MMEEGTWEVAGELVKEKARRKGKETQRKKYESAREKC